MYYRTFPGHGRGISGEKSGVSGIFDLARYFHNVLICMAWALFAAAAFMFPSPLSAGEEDVYADIMNRYHAVNDELSKALSDLEYETPLPDVPERVLSIRKNAIVTVGGEVRTAYVYGKSDTHDPGFKPADRPGGVGYRKLDAKAGELYFPTLKFLVDARIHERWRVFLDVNFSNTRGIHQYRRYANLTAPGAGAAAKEVRGYRLEEKTDLINQAYVELMKGDHSGLGFLVGRMKLPFGLWNRPSVLPQAFMDSPNLANSFLAGEDARSERALLPHASRMIDPVVAAMVNYEMRDIIRFDAAVFEERDTRKTVRVRGNGVTEVRSESSVPQSWQIGASIQPLEGWELTAHFRNRHNAGRGIGNFVDSPHRWDFAENRAGGGRDPRWDATNGQWSDSGTGPSFGSTKNEQSLIVGLAAEVPNTNLAVRAEYARGWNQGFNHRIKSENVNLGLTYKLTPRLTVHGQGEWLLVKDGSWMTRDGAEGWKRDSRRNHLYRAMVGLEYEAFKGMTVEAGWQYEYWRMKSRHGSDGLGPERRVNKGNMFYIGTRFVF